MVVSFHISLYFFFNSVVRSVTMFEEDSFSVLSTIFMTFANVDKSWIDSSSKLNWTRAYQPRFSDAGIVILCVTHDNNAKRRQTASAAIQPLILYKTNSQPVLSYHFSFDLLFFSFVSFLFLGHSSFLTLCWSDSRTYWPGSTDKTEPS